MIRRVLSKFWWRAMALVDTLRRFPGASATTVFPQEGLMSPPMTIATSPDAIALSLSDKVTGSVTNVESAFQRAILDLEPTSSWVLSDSNGVNAYDWTGDGNTGTLQNGVVASVSGPFPGIAAMQFTAADSQYVSTTTSVDNPTVFSLLSVFRTASASGVALGFANTQTGSPSKWDRNLWISSTGTLNFTVYNGNDVTVSSPSAANDGDWHWSVATMGADGMVLWLDGDQVGTNSNTSSQDYTGWWTIGGQADGSANPAFWNGELANQNVWDTVALTSADVSGLAAAWSASLS